MAQPRTSALAGTPCSIPRPPGVVTRYRVPAARHPDCITPILRDVRADSRPGWPSSTATPRARAPSGERPAHGGDLPAGQKPQRRVFPQALAGIPRPATLLLAGETAKVRVARRRPGRRSAHLGPAPVHRAAGPARLTPSQGPSALTTGLKVGALADILVAPKKASGSSASGPTTAMLAAGRSGRAGPALASSTTDSSASRRASARCPGGSRSMTSRNVSEMLVSTVEIPDFTMTLGRKLSKHIETPLRARGGMPWVDQATRRAAEDG